MTEAEITELFNDSLKERAVYKRLVGFSEDHIYNFRKGRTTATLGDMLSILYQLGLITINEST